MKDDKIGDHGFAVFRGLDVGKTAHHACALDPTGQRLHDKPLPNEEAALAEVFERLAGHGRVLVIVDQPASIDALAVAVARSLGIEVAYLPGLAMRRIADLHPGEGKTDARDAYVIADAARTMLHPVPSGVLAVCDLAGGDPGPDDPPRRLPVVRHEESPISGSIQRPRWATSTRKGGHGHERNCDGQRGVRAGCPGDH